jgi:hemerythrin-like metal-binding protein
MKTLPDYIEWDAKYEIHHDLIDSQHRIFVMLLNKLIANIVKGFTKEHLSRDIRELKKYAEFHFLSEENVMYDCDYPGLTNHELIHAEILHELNVLEERVIQDQASAEDVVLMLKNWLFSHIAIEDNHISQFIKEHEGLA